MSPRPDGSRALVWNKNLAFSYLHGFCTHFCWPRGTLWPRLPPGGHGGRSAALPALVLGSAQSSAVAPWPARSTGTLTRKGSSSPA